MREPFGRAYWGEHGGDCPPSVKGAALGLDLGVGMAPWRAAAIFSDLGNGPAVLFPFGGESVLAHAA